MQADLFLQSCEHFIYHTKTTKDEPILLLLDKHATLIKNTSIINTAKENGVTILQPLDLRFMGTSYISLARSQVMAELIFKASIEQLCRNLEKINTHFNPQPGLSINLENCNRVALRSS
ncbi:hypothetical protein PR048_028697 [Dryococelus australis]|uniref:Uncharacterized protein n=1 Tax=Dryococelus australis TaxID=614101 RepID=A0ABQ9GBY7_9NEOP|nr:hypothetical protein PR048_028697 [Dryococelus australis]